MFDCKFRSKLKKLNRSYEKTVATYDKEIALAKSNDEREQLKRGRVFEVGQLDEDIHEHITNFYQKKARYLMIEMPDFNHDFGFWHRSNTTGIFSLTTKGVADIRQRIRAERMARFDNFSKWLALSIGLVGALTGLASALFR